MKKTYLYKPESTNLADFKPNSTGGYDSKDHALSVFNEYKKQLSDLQDKLYAQRKHALLIILQGMDASGKDGVIKHVMSGVNPQGCKVKSFETPTIEEYRHDYLWRCIKELPERGYIGLFNRSYYEEVLIVRVHPEIIHNQCLPNITDDIKNNQTFWNTRYEDINNFERYLTNNGIHILKFFLNISKEEQRKRFLKRINDSVKNWKFKSDDIKERAYWDEYMKYYQILFDKTSTDKAPWYIIPADKKWYSRLAISEIILDKLKELDLTYPEANFKQKRGIVEAEKILKKE